MKIYSEISLTDFEFWSGGKENASYLTEKEMETIEYLLEDLFPNGISETELNDIFWFDCDTIAEWLGYEDFEKITER